jgi:hypothetical protein
MSISFVNGFQCRNCTDIDYAKKHIDPAHPQDGPYGINAKDHPGDTQKASQAQKTVIPVQPNTNASVNGLNIVV